MELNKYKGESIHVGLNLRNQEKNRSKKENELSATTSRQASTGGESPDKSQKKCAPGS